ncbi:hypothetical protein [Caballeronia humi]|uniref:Uncharacterized protein n=1 Tax=Caballeronia humi TaxID=326474 RepID=A0A158HKD9_9BURK|nr:hypothetical protein [Caballeronia humi]SAL44543.1 hypothetical protein AWB65_03441 [Caballeronia humi]
MAIELKTDAWHRYMLYRSNDARLMPFASCEEKQAATDAGKRFTSEAFADVWARDLELVKRVRLFLRANFHWHERLANSGTDLDVVETLMDMVRGGSVLVVPEDAPVSAGLPAASPAASSFWGVENYDPPRYASVQEQYQAQLADWEANATPWEEIEAMNDSINAKFMHAVMRVEPTRLLPLFERAGWISKYGLPDPSKWAEEGAVSTPLGDALPFEYGEEALGGEVEELAASTRSPRFAAKMLGYDQHTFSAMLHEFKPENGLRPSDNVIFFDDGSVEFNGKLIDDNMHNYAP